MKFPYIVAIIAGALFVLLFVIFVVSYVRLKKKDAEKQALIKKSYTSDAPVRIDYDFAAYDEETEKLLEGMQKEASQLTIDEVLTSVVPAVEDAVFAKMEKDEPEEITGNYKPE